MKEKRPVPDKVKYCFDQNDHHNRNAKHKHTVTLTSGTTTISDQSTANTDVIFAGTSATNEPLLQFVGSGANPNPVLYSVGSFTVAGDPWQGGTPAYGSLELDYQARIELTHGLRISDGELDITQVTGSDVTLDGNSIIDNGGSLVSRGYRGTGFDINGTLTLGQSGNNVFGGYVTETNGPGVIRELGNDDVVGLNEANSNLRVDIRAGTLSIGSEYAIFAGTIGPAPGSRALSLGPSATAYISLYPTAVSVETAKFDTSTGMLSLLDAVGKDLADIHFTGDARGLNLAVSDYSLVVTDHPGTASPIPISFT